ncbi:hypothetical protein FE391_39005 [Nonomuraea sp. KC401]|uniref:hypothetical protein n=1 Tax=unclassified Nonomuraea TaxID=2593643 RepID=UPI0010FDAC8A|nr:MULTISPECIES: hypothetical protein [unclassified Nonomuraea]NBE99975.1 hypothetical protein [Nonomuraea sp. K271]TLF56613.1 hypothetical protein FE391_39005 [Nonomuraea sp. KC401]
MSIRGLGDALTDERDGTSPVSHLDAAGRLPEGMRIGMFAMGVLGAPFAFQHDNIVGYAEQMVRSTVSGLYEHREGLHLVTRNNEIAEAGNEEHVQRI